MSARGGPSTSTNMREYFYGWDLLYKTVENNISAKSDVIIALVHFVLTKHANMHCVGIGEDKSIHEDEEGSELLPDGWNDLDNKYALRYVFNKKLYLLLGHKTVDSLIINLLDVQTHKVSNIGLDPDITVQVTKGSINTMIPNTSQLVDRFRRELIDPVYTGVTREVTTQTQGSPPTLNSSQSDPLRIGQPRRPSRPRGIGDIDPFEPRPFGFPEVGRGDLDPLGRGAGNLFPFPSHPDFRNGPGVGPAQPRFDPFGPPDGGTRPNPNPDHFRPPNFGNDYYM